MGNHWADHVTPLYPQTLVLTSPTGGGRSVGIVRSRTKATEFSFSLVLQSIQWRIGKDGRNLYFTNVLCLWFTNYSCYKLCIYIISPPHDTTNSAGANTPHYRGFKSYSDIHIHTDTHTNTLRRVSLDWRSALRREIYLRKHKTYKRERERLHATGVIRTRNPKKQAAP